MLSAYRTKVVSLSRASLQQTTLQTNALQTTSKRVFHSTKQAQQSTSSASSSANPIASFPKTHPFAFQLMVATGKTSAADIVCQVVAERKKWDEIDWKRNGIFVVFGFACK